VTVPGFDTLAVFASHYPKLQRFSRLDNAHLTSAGLAALSSNCPKVTTLWWVPGASQTRLWGTPCSYGSPGFEMPGDLPGR
jgi:hypothetical protein